MSNLIDKQTAIASAISGRVRTEDGERWIRVSEVRENLMNVPIAYVVEQKRGKWMHDKDDMIISGYCSCCGWTSIIYETDVADMPYCPNCGAEMRERRNDG